MVSSGKRRLSNDSNSARSGKRVVKSRTDSGLHRHHQPNRNTSAQTGATGVVRQPLDASKRPPRVPGAGKRPAGLLGASKRPAGVVGASKRPAGAADSVARPSKRARVESSSSGPARRNTVTLDQENETCAAILRERKAARQMKWSQRVFRGRSVSAACFGASTVSLAPAEAGPVESGSASVAAVDPSSAPAGDTVPPGGVRSCGGGGIPRNRRRSSGGGAAATSVRASGVRLNKAAQRRMEKNKLTLSTASLNSVARRQTMAIAAKPAASTTSRRFTTLPVQNTRGEPCRRPTRGQRRSFSATDGLRGGRTGTSRKPPASASVTDGRAVDGLRDGKTGISRKPTAVARAVDGLQDGRTGASRKPPASASADGRAVDGPQNGRTGASRKPSVSAAVGSAANVCAADDSQAGVTGGPGKLSADTNAAGKAGVSGKPSARVGASTQRRTLSTMHRAGGGRRSLAIKASTKPNSIVANIPKPFTAADNTQTPASGRKRVRRNSYSVDEAHVAATPHIRRPSIFSLSAARVSQLPAAPTGAVTPASTSSPTRRTPVGFIPPSANIPLQLRLKKWLAKRGKSLSSYRHLQCFHSTPTSLKSAPASTSKRLTNKSVPTPAKVVETRSAEVAEVKPQSDDSVSVSCQPDGTNPTVSDPSGGDCNHVDDDTKPNTLNQAIDELRELQMLGLPVEQLEAWLLRLSAVPGSLQRAGYWLCHAAAAEKQGRLDQLLDSFRQASCAQAEPVSELVDGLQSLLSRATGAAPCPSPAPDSENQSPVACPGVGGTGVTPARARRRPLLDTANIFRSSTVKYAVVESGQDASTHFLLLAKRVSAVLSGCSTAAAGKPAVGGCIPSAIITPVRRSTRKQCMVPPSAAPHCAHVTIVDSLESISDVLRQSALFARNSALKLTP